MIRASLFLALLALQDTVSEDLPRVGSVRGTVLVWRAGKNRVQSVGKETRVAPQDRIGTKTGEYALLVAEGDALVSLKGIKAGAEGGLAVLRDGKKLLLKLYKGKLVLESFQTELSVETPHGRVEGKKAYFLVEVKGDATRVVAIDGGLTFTNSLGSVTLKPGEEIRAKKGEKPPRPTKADVRKAVREFEVEEQSANLLRNPGFEKNLNDWKASDHNGKKRTSIDDKVFHSGTRSVRLEVSNRIYGKTRADKWLGFAQKVKLVPGRRYLVRAYLRSRTRTGEVIPMLSMDGVKGKDSWRASCEERWVMKRVVVIAQEEDCTVNVEADVKSDIYDCLIWADDIALVELP